LKLMGSIDLLIFLKLKMPIKLIVRYKVQRSYIERETAQIKN